MRYDPELHYVYVYRNPAKMSRRKEYEVFDDSVNMNIVESIYLVNDEGEITELSNLKLDGNDYYFSIRGYTESEAVIIRNRVKSYLNFKEYFNIPVVPYVEYNPKNNYAISVFRNGKWNCYSDAMKKLLKIWREQNNLRVNKSDINSSSPHMIFFFEELPNGKIRGFMHLKYNDRNYRYVSAFD